MSWSFFHNHFHGSSKKYFSLNRLPFWITDFQLSFDIFWDKYHWVETLFRGRKKTNRLSLLTDIQMTNGVILELSTDSQRQSNVSERHISWNISKQGVTFERSKTKLQNWLDFKHYFLCWKNVVNFFLCTYLWNEIDLYFCEKLYKFVAHTRSVSKWALE